MFVKLMDHPIPRFSYDDDADDSDDDFFILWINQKCH